MLKYIFKRILSSILVLLGVVTITFFIARVIPSNPEVKWAGQRATPEQLEAARIELGLDKSLPEQYVIYLRDLLHGNLGMSLNTIDHCLRDARFSMEQIRVIAGYMLPFSGEFLDYAGLRDTWKYLKEFIDMVNTIDEKDDLKNVCRSLMVYVNYVHAWTHLMAPWGNGGAGYNFRSKEENEALSKYYLSEDYLKTQYPFDRGQVKF